MARQKFLFNWHFFDTNCLSELAKLNFGNYQKEVQNFLFKKEVILFLPNIIELTKRPDLLSQLDETLKSSKLYLLPDLQNLLYSEIETILKDKSQHSIFNYIIPVSNGSLSSIPFHNEIKSEINKMNSQIEANFLLKVTQDINTDFSLYDLGTQIQFKINEYCENWFNTSIKNVDIRADLFPAFFTYYYVYFYRYIKGGSRPELNDAMDLTNLWLIPYCKAYYCERSFGHTLRVDIQGRSPLSQWEIIQRTHKVKKQHRKATYLFPMNNTKS